MKIKTICLCVIVLVTVSYSEARSDLLTKRLTDDVISETRTQHQTGTEGKELIRHKRGWGSILFTGAGILLKTTTLGLTLGAALSNGCSYYKSICTDKKEIERLENLVKPLKSQLEAEYENAKRTYYNIREATTNNGYIAYYINDTLQKVENIQKIEDDLTLKLELSLPKLSKVYEASKNSTFKQYLNSSIGQLEYRLSDIKIMLDQNRNNVLIGLLAQYMIEAAVNRFFHSYKTAYQQLEDGDILATTNAKWWERMEGSETTVETKKGIKYKIKLVPKVFKRMAQNFGKRISKFATSVRKWSRIRTWKGFKGKFKASIKVPLQKLTNVKNFLVHKKTRTTMVKEYRLTLGKTIMTSIGIVGDIVTNVMTAVQWAKVRDEMAKARRSYEEYYNKLKAELASIARDKGEMAEQWDEIIKVFKDLCLPFKSLIKNATQYSNFSEVIGLSKLPVDTSSPLFTTNFDTMTVETIKSNQLAVRNFLISVDNNMTVIEDKMKARQVFYNNALSKSESEDPIADIHSDIVNIFKYSTSSTMKTYGQNLKLDDTVCTLSILRYDLDEYDFYPLVQFRPRCEVNESTFETWREGAQVKRNGKLMREIVLNKVANGQEESLSKLVDAIHNAYLGVQNKNMSKFGASITNKDVCCLISKEFPSKQIYDFINLDPFRPNCAAVTTDMFQKLMNDGAKLRTLVKGITNDLNTCTNYKICLCLSQIATTHGVTENEIKDVLRHINPAWKPNDSPVFCSETGCGCRHL